MTVDYTQAQDRSKMLRAMMGQNFQPVQGANMGTALGKILTSYFLSKGMDRQGNLMQEAVKNEDNRKRMDLGRMMSAYREDTPYQPGPDELMPGEQPIPGLKMEGQGRNRDALLMAMAGNPDYAGAALPAMVGAGMKDNRPKSVVEYEYAESLSPEDRERFMEVKRSPGAKTIDLKDRIRVIDGAGKIIGEFEKGIYKTDTVEFAGEKSQAQAISKGQVERWDTQMDEGLRAADGIPVLQRSLSLLEAGVKTGGFDTLKLAVSNFFGVTGADEAELSANLGRAVLSQLRSTFGAAFTEREGDRLNRIEANFGKSTEANIRLLKELDTMARREAKRGIRAATRAGDIDTANEIQTMLDFKIEDRTEKAAEIKTVTTQEEYDALESGAIFIEDGKRYKKP